MVQEAWARAWERWEVVVGGYDDPEAWVRRAAYRVAVSRWRRVRRLVGTNGLDRAMDDAGYDRVGANDALIAALRTLPRGQQRALVLHYLAGIQVSAVAAELDVAEGTVKSLLWRGRRRLAARLVEAEALRGKEVTSG